MKKMLHALTQIMRTQIIHNVPLEAMTILLKEQAKLCGLAQSIVGGKAGMV